MEQQCVQGEALSQALESLIIMQGEELPYPPPFPPRAGAEMQAHVPHSKAQVCSHLCGDGQLTPHLGGEKQGEEAHEYQMNHPQEL